jgi:hypothetical protein
MLREFAKVATALSLILSASFAAPAWSAGKAGASAEKCPDAKRKLANRTPPPQPARSVTIVEKRKLDVQILSFGP